MCSTTIIEEKGVYRPVESGQHCSDLPICPNGCGPLAFTPTRDIGSARLACPACRWRIALLPDEERDLVQALAGLTPDLPLDLFLAAVVQTQVAALHEEWLCEDGNRNRLKARWEGLCDLAVAAYEEWRETDACADAAAREHTALVDALAKLRGVTPQVILGLPAGAAYGLR
jgi:hypothetical protein